MLNTPVRGGVAREHVYGLVKVRTPFEGIAMYEGVEYKLTILHGIF